MPSIRVLDDALIGKIAAGEVVERPASVVKELVENALDAGASSVEVELERGGLERIRVADDGAGMAPEDAERAFERHATSKIGSFDDLERVGTLGFRGEALAAIAAVARVELLTAAGPGAGHRVRLEGSRRVLAEPTAAAPGTSVEVASLFFNVPARRKFLKTPRTELSRCLEVVRGYALAYPEVRFALRHDGREAIAVAPTGSGAEATLRRIEQIFGSQLAGALLPIPRGDGVAGFVGDRTTTRGRRYFVFVNRRLIRDRQVMASYYRAVREAWRADDFPALFLYLDLPPEEVDVNVHPQKAEVRFRDGRYLHRLFRRLRDGLAGALGEVPAPLERLEGGFGLAPAAWQGLGERGPATPSGTGAPGAAAWVGEGQAAHPSLAQPAYAPIEPRPVPLSGRDRPRTTYRLLGQYKGTVVLLEGPDGLYLIDQHVAHERLLYERLRRQMAEGEVAAQRFLEPLLLELSPSESERLRELQEPLQACGFDLRELSGDTFGLASAPAALSAGQSEALLKTLAAEGAADPEPAALREAVLDSLAASLACRAAVKMHEPLGAEEMERLVAELFAAEQPFACPHGRPVMLRMTDRDLERRFGRR
ncbi:MAG: DNA mismatch repair endonuclease MutL [Thermoanaerobaculia bacterium]|nr:DNA mismatch repair endonuclease MutL [Thermoanaerobaculia bacterium]